MAVAVSICAENIERGEQMSRRKNEDARSANPRRSARCKRIVFGWLPILISLGWVMNGSAAVASTSDQPEEGIRCVTHNRFREIARDQFVVDHITECGPLRANSVPVQAQAAPVSSTALESGVLQSDSEDRVAIWSAARSRLSNAQYDRSLRAMRGVFVGRGR